MTETILLKIQYPPGSFKKTATVKLSLNNITSNTIAELTKGLQIIRSEILIFCVEGLNKKWLKLDQSLGEQKVTTNVCAQIINQVFNMLVRSFFEKKISEYTSLCFT